MNLPKYPDLPFGSTPQEVQHLLLEAFGANYRKKAANYFRVNLRTVKRWLRGSSRPPHSVLILLCFSGWRTSDFGQNH